jgi:predicted MPP superfamily phosphohydrolase
MRSDFLFSAVCFHVVFGLVCAWFVRSEARRLREGPKKDEPTGWGTLVRFLGLLALAIVLAVVLGLTVRPQGFTVMRLLAQALFGELVLVSFVLAVLHVRARRHGVAVALATVSAGLLAAYVEGYHREPKDLVVRRHELGLRRGAPPAGRIRIVHLSDLQTHQVGAHEERALREALRQKPDLIVMTGDFIQPRLDDTQARAQADLRLLLRRLHVQAPLGVYAVQGDTDHDWPGVLQGTPVRCLTNEVAEIDLPGGRSLSLVGLAVGQSRRPDRSTFELVDRVPKGRLRVVAGHSPDYVMGLAGRVHVDLALGGHTHGGQIVVPGFGPPLTLSRLPRRYASGLNIYEGIPLHVSPGIGMERLTAPQVRFLCPPEVSVLDLSY